MHTIDVKPVGEKAWMVEYSGAQNSLLFMSGASAERSARRLAQQLVAAGRPTKVSVFLRDGSLAGAFLGTGRAAAG